MSSSFLSATTAERWNVAEPPLRQMDEARHLARHGELLDAPVWRDLTIRYKRSFLDAVALRESVRVAEGR